MQTNHSRVKKSEGGDIVIEDGEFWWDAPEEKEEDEVELVKGNVDISDGDIELEVLNILNNKQNQNQNKSKNNNNKQKK